MNSLRKTGVFHPRDVVLDCALEVARERGLPDDWLNDGVKEFLPGEPASRDVVWSGPHLTVWIPPLDYLLAMKVAASRVETSDVDDIIFLAKRSGLSTAASIEAVAARY